MRLGIFSNLSRDIGYEIGNRCAALIAQNGAVAVFPEDAEQRELINTGDGIEFGPFNSCDIIITIGGDGTLLGAVSKYRSLDIPFVGINKGSIGFLTQIDVDRLEKSIRQIIDGNYEILNRFQLSCKVIGEDGALRDEFVCLNDCVVTRGAKLNIVKMDLWIDNQYVEKFYGDGIIVSTPTGSTAYSLAAGGPILMPNMKNMIVTPLCPHTLQSSSYCIGAESLIEIRMGQFESAPILSGDGRGPLELKPNDRVLITGFGSPVKTVMLGDQGFFQAIRSKITARGSFYEYKK